MLTVHKFRRQVKKLLHQLEIDGPFDVALFCNRLLHKKCLHILLQSYPMPLGLSAFLARYEEVYVIFYQENASPFFREYFCFHELAHILLRHPEPDVERLLAGDHIYSQRKEREAEMMAAALMDATWSKPKIGEFCNTFKNLIFGEKEKERKSEQSLQKVADFFLRLDYRC